MVVSYGMVCWPLAFHQPGSRHREAGTSQLAFTLECDMAMRYDAGAAAYDQLTGRWSQLYADAALAAVKSQPGVRCVLAQYRAV